MPPPLAGLRALDLTDALGYLCGRLLADLGALVIKVEPPGGDPGRALGPRYRAPDGREHGLYWHAMNAGKLGVTLALEHPEAPRVLADLAAASTSSSTRSRPKGPRPVSSPRSRPGSRRSSTPA